MADGELIQAFHHLTHSLHEWAALSSGGPGKCWLGAKGDDGASSSHPKWLLGALLAELSAILHTLACVMLRRSGKKSQRTRDLCSSFYCWGWMALRGFAWIVSWTARCQAPDSTVAPIYLIVVLVTNLAAAPPILQEQFRGTEVIATFACMAFVIVAARSDFSIIETWPNRRVMVLDYACIGSELRFALSLFFCFWLVAFLVSFGMIMYDISYEAGWKDSESSHVPPRKYLLKKMKKCQLLNHSRKAFLIPVSLGLLEGFTHFVGYIGFPWCNFGSVDQSVSDFNTLLIIITLLFFFACPLAFEGALNFDCRFFVPVFTTVGFLVSTVLRACVDKKVSSDTSQIIWLCFLQLLIVITPVFWISSADTPIKLPRTLMRAVRIDEQPKKREVVRSLRTEGTVGFLPMVVTPLLEFGATEKESMPHPEEVVPMLRLYEPKRYWKLSFFKIWARIGQFVPVLFLLAVPVVLVYFFYRGQHMFGWAVALLAAFLVCGAGVQMTIFTGIGCYRLSLCMDTDYSALCKNGQKRHAKKKMGGFASGGRLLLVNDPFDSGSSSSEDDDIDWEGVRHLVLARSSAESESSFEQLRILLDSIAMSPLAKQKIGVVYSLPNVSADGRGDEEAKIGARSLEQQYVDSTSIKYLRAVPHGRDLVAYTLNTLVPHSPAFFGHMTLITLTTLDAVFHEQYFSALTFAFLEVGRVRSGTIWQPPVFYLRNYFSQSYLERYTSLYRAHESLMRLNDPLAVPLPSSTYSVPLTLLKTMQGCWEPDYPLPENCGEWTKCWFSTIGKCRPQPIFLPVMKNSFTFGRMVESHAARGLRELSYFWGVAPLALMNRQRLPIARLVSLCLRSLPPFFRMAWDHAQLSSWLLIMIVNALMLTWGWIMWEERETYSSHYLLGVTAELFGIGIFTVLVASHLTLIKVLGSCIEPCTQATQNNSYGLTENRSNVLSKSDARHGEASGKHTRALISSWSGRSGGEAGGGREEGGGGEGGGGGGGVALRGWLGAFGKPAFLFGSDMVHGAVLIFQGFWAGPIFLSQTFYSEWSVAIDTLELWRLFRYFERHPGNEDQ